LNKNSNPIADHLTACGLTKDDLVIRVGPERYAEALVHPYAREMGFTGRPMKGWVYVNPERYASDKDPS
jgi:hypothetical protein